MALWALLDGFVRLNWCGTLAANNTTLTVLFFGSVSSDFKGSFIVVLDFVMSAWSAWDKFCKAFLICCHAHGHMLIRLIKITKCYCLCLVWWLKEFSRSDEQCRRAYDDGTKMFLYSEFQSRFDFLYEVFDHKAKIGFRTYYALNISETNQCQQPSIWLIDKWITGWMGPKIDSIVVCGVDQTGIL